MDRTGIGPILGPSLKILFALCSCLYKTCIDSSLVYFTLSRVGPPLCFMVMFGVWSASYSKSSYPLDIMYAAFI